MIDLVAAASRHSQLLFGEPVATTELQVAPVARGTRHIYRLRAAARPHLPVVVAKLRLPRSASAREIAANEASNEFAVLSAVRSALGEQGRPENAVPRPLLVLPQDCLIFMQYVEGQPVSRFLRHWTLGLRSTTQTSKQLLRCGDWLHAFSRLSSAVITAGAPALSAVLETRRARHHVYRLIGLSGAALVDAMLTGIEKRLTAYGHPVWLKRIEAVYSKQFRDFGPSRDLQVAVHGKYSPDDIFMHDHTVTVLDLEQGGVGSACLDIAYFLYQVYMTARWRPLGRSKGVAELRSAFMRGRSGEHQIDDDLVDCFIAYYVVNSLRPGGGFAGMRARAYASRWLNDWVLRAGG